jgi:hypothetical protein
VAELVDYSGAFDPKFSHGKFTRETLLKLLKMYSEYMLRIDGFWYLTVMDKWGNEEAFDCDVRVWEKAQLYETKMISSLLNIRGDDVVTVMKAMQASPWMWIYDYEMEVKSNEHAILTIRTCPTLLSLEKEGKGREKLICQEMEPKIMGIVAHYFNPNIRVTPLKMPPRKIKDEIPCKWEFKLER